MTNHMPQHVIAERYVTCPWPITGPEAKAIKKARQDYEDGKIEMATRREGRMEYLYAIPRKRPGTKRPGYWDSHVQ